MQTIENIKNPVQFSRTLQGRNVILVGGWEPQIDVMFPDAAAGNTLFVYLLSEQQLLAALHEGYAVYYLPAIRAFNASVYGVDVAKFGAQDLRAVFEERARKPAISLRVQAKDRLFIASLEATRVSGSPSTPMAIARLRGTDRAARLQLFC